MNIKWWFCITVFLYISIKPVWTSCTKTYISSCNYTILCIGHPDRISEDNCGNSAYYTFILTNSLQSALTTSFFASTNFDSRVRKIHFYKNVYKLIEKSALRYYYNTIEMDLSNNEISWLGNQTFDNLQSLKFLNLSHNGIETIAPHTFLISTNVIEVLDLSHNKLTALGTELNDMPHLKTLYLNNNKLESTLEGRFQNLGSLNHLYLQHNRFAELKLALINLRKLTILDVSDNYLVKLSGFELNQLGSIININVSHNALSTVEANCFNQAFNLTSVDFSYNNIQMIIESGMFINNNKLKYLNFYNNHITGLQDNFLKYTAVDYLNLTNNNVSGIFTGNTFSGLQRVTELDLTKQNITGIGNNAFTAMRSLLSLNLSKNSIRTVDNTSFMDTSIRILDLSHNKIQDLSFLKNCLTNLTEFIISNNNIQLIKENAFESQTQIVKLDLSYNKIIKVDQKSLPLLKLQYFNIVGNQLTGTVEKNIFSPAKYLRSLDLSNFNITGINDMAFVDLPVLARLNLSHNQIEKIEASNFKGVTNMQSLDISYNKLSDVKLEKGTLKNLKALYLNNNNLESISGIFPANSSLLYLDTSSNNMSSPPDIEFETLPNLNTLILAQNKIKEFNNRKINTLSSLVDLNLSANNLTDVKLSYFKKLVSVELSNNNIKYINTTFLDNGDNLRYIDLSRNKITILTPGTFQYMKNLNFLNLSTNFIAKLRYGSLRGLHKTKLLDISKNNLTSLDADLLHECNELESLIIDDNRIKSFDVDRLLTVAPMLRTISLGGNRILCKEIIRTAHSLRPVNVTAIDKIYHEDNVHGIRCGVDIYQVSTSEGHQVTTVKPEPITPKAVSDLSSSTVVIVWCSLLTLVLIGIGGVIVMKFYKVRVFAYSANESSRASLELNGSELHRDLLS